MVGKTTGPEGDDSVDAAEIRAELDRVLAADAFRNAPQLTAFLSYVVERTLAGHAGDLKGYTIAVEAFGRPSDFDPQADPIVRVEAGRLRRALSLYFAAEGAQDPVRISIPVGAYVPLFARAPTPVPPLPAASAASENPGEGANPIQPVAAERYWLYGACLALLLGLVAVVFWHWQGGQAPPAALPRATEKRGSDTLAPESQQAHLPVVSVSVLPAEGASDPALDEVMRGFSRHLIDTMARFDDLITVKDPSPTGKPGSGADYVLELSTSRLGDTVEGYARLSTVKDRRIVWTGSAARPAAKLGDGGEIREAAQMLAIRLAQSFGIIHADLRQASLSPEADCIALAANFRRQMRADDHLAARACLEEIVGRDPDFPPAWSQLALLTLDEYRSGINPLPGPALDRALSAAVTAVRLAPSSARAHQALMETLLLRGAVDDAREAGAAALRLNPYDPEAMAGLGALNVQLDRAAEGLPLLQRAVALSPGRPPWYDFYLFLAAKLTGNTKLADTHAALISSEQNALSLLARAMACASQGDETCRSDTLRTIALKQPLFGLDARLYLARKGFSASVSERIIAGIGLSSPLER